MKILDYMAFGKDLFQTLGLFEGAFSENKWEKFLEKYFKSVESRKIIQQIDADLLFFRSQDPASREYENAQILSVRRGMLAILAHRVFEAILAQNEKAIFEVEILAKTIQVATSVEIHPQAKIGYGFSIDHGHGTVIGATTEMGKNVFLYHGVTMGASGRYLQNGRRHPKVGDNVFLGNGVQVLGPSLIGDDTSVGSESMVIDSVIGCGVRISPGVLVSKVKVPDGYMIFGFDALTRKFIGKTSESNGEVETFQLERIDITRVRFIAPAI